MRYLYLTLVFLLSISQLAFSQSDSARLTTIASKLEKLSATHPVEKVYLHFNKPAYNTGDTIWFKGYVTVGTHHQPSALSGVLYIDLIDGRNKIVKSLTIKSENGIAVGDFTLDKRTMPGDYRIRAYTTWMRNNDPDYFFNQTILIGDVKTNAVMVNTTYAVNHTAIGEPVATKLTYTDKEGRPFAKREVNYEVRADTSLLYKGKGVTDDNGNLSFTFPGKTAPGQNVKAISHIKIMTGAIIDKTTPINLLNENLDVQFFPEGGLLVNDVRSKIAFKAIGTNGLGIDIKGAILDNDNNPVAEFQSQHLGMGVFALTPQPGKTYTAKITLTDNSVITAKLPQAQEKGFVLAVNNAGSTKLTVRVATNETTLAERKGQSFYLVGQSGGVVYYTTLGKLDNASFTASVPKSKFSSGIAQFTLFSSTNEPLNERVVFIQNNADLLKLSLSAPKNTYAPKEKVSMAFNAKDNTSKPILGSFSLSVYNDDLSPVNENAESTILSNILLTSDLKGFIEQPNYYFNNQNKQPDIPEGYHEHDKQADLDILMLTQGYRRFDWKEIINDNYPALVYKPEKSLSLSGTLTNSSKKPVKGTIKLLSVVDKISVDTTSDIQGKFTIANLNFADTAKVLLQARKANNDNDVNIILDSKQLPVVYKTTVAYENAYSLPPAISDAIKGEADTTQIGEEIKKSSLKFKGNNLLKEVTIKQQRNNYGTENAPWMGKASTRSANLNGPGHANQVFDAAQLEDCFDFHSVMLKVPGVSGSDGKYSFARHAAQSFSGIPGVRFIINGIMLMPGNSDEIKYLNVNTIESVEVLNSSSYLNIYGTEAPGGLVIITTKAGTADPNVKLVDIISPGVITTKFKGFSKTEQFYVPKYTASNINTADNRTAIYWDPNLTTDEKGNLPIEFFNSDIKGAYRAVIEGIDNDGNIGRYVYRYKVQ